MNTPYQNLYWIKRMGQTVRFHGTNPLTRSETVFHHSASVAAILLKIVPEECTFELLAAAITHDLPEGVTGDIPAPVKMLLGYSKLENMEEDVLSFYNMLDDRIECMTTDQKSLLKSADRLDAMLTCLMERMRGNSEVDWAFGVYCQFYKKLGCHLKFKAIFEEVIARYQNLNTFDTNHELAARFLL